MASTNGIVTQRSEKRHDMSKQRKCKAEKQGCAINQAVPPACMYTEVGHGLRAVVAASCMSTGAAANCPPVHSRKDSVSLRSNDLKEFDNICCHLEDLVLNFCSFHGKAMASPDHLAKRRRLNSPLSGQEESPNDYVCYGMVSLMVLFTSAHTLAKHSV